MLQRAFKQPLHVSGKKHAGAKYFDILKYSVFPLKGNMTVDNPPIISSSIKKLILVSALLGYAALVLYLLYFVGLNELAIVIGKANIGIYFLAIASLIASLTFHTLVWYQLLRSLSVKLSLRRTYVLYWVGVFVDNLIPGGWSGDLFKAYLLNKDPSIQSGKAVASVVAKNVYEAIFNFGSIVFALILLFLNYQLEGSILISLGGIMLLLTLPLFVLLTSQLQTWSCEENYQQCILFYLAFGQKPLELCWSSKESGKRVDRLS